MTKKNSDTFTHKQMAVNCFNKVWTYLDKQDRTDEEAEMMIHLSHSSFWHWTQVEDHTSQNLSIGYWQLSRVYAVVKNGALSLKYGSRCVYVSEEASLDPFFIAYAYEALARSQVLLSRLDDAEKSMKLAEEYKDRITDKSNRDLVETDLLSIKI